MVAESGDALACGGRAGVAVVGLSGIKLTWHSMPFDQLGQGARLLGRVVDVFDQRPFETEAAMRGCRCKRGTPGSTLPADSAC